MGAGGDIHEPQGGRILSDGQVTIGLRLNQQQLELIDRTIAAGAAADRVALVKRALSETRPGYAAGQVVVR